MIKPELLAALASITEFHEALAAIHASGYTGPFTVHCFSGMPQRIELPPPPPEPVIIPLGKAARSAKRGLTPPAPLPHAIG